MKRWKAVLWDYLSLSQYDNDTLIPVCLTARECSILKTSITTARWATRWTGLTGAMPDDLLALIDGIEYKLDQIEPCGESDMLYFRDNPNDTCEVQYSHDGINWLTMFRKDTCRDTSWSLGDVITTNNQVINNHNTYQGDITNVAPNWVYNDLEPEWSNKSLCYAIRKYVDIMCDTAIKTIQSNNDDRRNENEWLDDLATIVGTVGATVAAELLISAGVSVALPAAAPAAIAWATLRIIDSIWEKLVDEDYSAFEDADVRNAIACAMYCQMQGHTPQFAEWENSLADYRLTWAGDYAIVAEYINTCNSDVDVFIQYMVLMEGINEVAEYLDECPCTCEWTHNWNFAERGMEAWTLGSYGEYQEGIGVVGTARVEGNYNSITIDNLYLSESINRVVSMTLLLNNCVRGTFDYWPNSLELRYDPEPIAEFNAGWFITGRTSYTWTLTDGPIDTTKIGVKVIRASYKDVPPANGSVAIWGMQLHGHGGPDPFLGRDTA